MAKKQLVKVWNKFIVPTINVLACTAFVAAVVAMIVMMGMMWLSGQY